MKIYLDGKYVDSADAKVSVFDHGLLYGDGVFEGIRIYNGRVFRLTEHLVRLYESARSILLTIPLSFEEMEKATLQTVAANGLRDGYIRLVVTRGVGSVFTETTNTRSCSTLLCLRLCIKADGATSASLVRKTAVPETRVGFDFSNIRMRSRMGMECAQHSSHSKKL